jgi:hypothetical protein
LTFTKGDLHAALIQAQPGNGTITTLRPDLNAARPTPTPPLPVPPIKESTSPENIRPGITNYQLSHILRRIPISNFNL